MNENIEIKQKGITQEYVNLFLEKLKEKGKGDIKIEKIVSNSLLLRESETIATVDFGNVDTEKHCYIILSNGTMTFCTKDKLEKFIYMDLTKESYIGMRRTVCDMFFDTYIGTMLSEEIIKELLGYSDHIDMLLSSLTRQLNSEYQLLDLEKAFKSKDVRKSIDNLNEYAKKELSKYSVVDIKNFYPNFSNHKLLTMIRESNYKNPIGRLLQVVKLKNDELITKLDTCKDCGEIGKLIMLIYLYLLDIHYLLAITKDYFYQNNFAPYFNNEINGIEILIETTDIMLKKCRNNENKEN